MTATTPDLLDLLDTTEAEATPPDVAALFDAIWEGDTNGFSRAQVEGDLDDARNTLEQLEAGRIRPQVVVGRHVRKPKTAARAYLKGRIADCERDLTTHGRTNTVNIGNVRFRLPEGHEAKRHVLVYKASPDYAHLYKAVCSCGWVECGYSATTIRHARDVERHLETGERR